MKYDREEAYLHEKLTGGLHPAEHLPDAPPHGTRAGSWQSAWPRRC